MDQNSNRGFHISSIRTGTASVDHSLTTFNTSSCFHITASTICLDHITIKIQTKHRNIIHQAFFLAVSSVEITKVITFVAIIKNKAHITKYNATLMNGYIIFSYIS
ncbi:hypothetical protein J6T66_04145 [bacterium]|nr:hypothetical protein [bacterium]